jgi:predicted DNA-binding protein (MmcQ/YjbR family)
MVTQDTFRKMALAFLDATEEPHFEKPSFRVNKKIFATLDLKNDRAVLKLSETDQSVFGAFDKAIIYPVKGTWGKQGWTTVELKTIRKDMLKAMLTAAYCHVAPARLSKKHLDS